MSQATDSGGNRMAAIFMSLLALQFGMQPVLVRKYTPSSTCRSSIIIVQEIVKFVIAIFLLLSSGQLKSALEGWTFQSWLTIAFLPAALYVVQNLSALVAYQHLHPVTFNVLNQTKTLSAALCCYIIIGRKQSSAQVFSLLLLLLSALVIEGIVTIDFIFGKSKGGNEATAGHDIALEARHFTHGVMPILLASFISGLAGAISQKSLQSASGCSKSGGKNAVLFSAEMCIASLIILGGSLPFNADLQCIKNRGFFADWNGSLTLIPILTNALGGIFVGLVTKYAGSVRKGFALIFGLILSGVIQAITERSMDGSHAISAQEVVGAFLASFSLWIHVTHPYKTPISDIHTNGGTKGAETNAKAQATTAKTRRGRKSRKED